MATPTDSASPPSTALRPPALAPLPAAPGHGVCTEDTRLVKDKLSRVAGGEGDKATVNKDYTTRMLPWLLAIDSAFYCGESKIQKTLLEKRELHMERELLLD
ncbi:unnamed protein product [Miscanthus lutarioriparius]|uniref:Uncharacterized protein n=1 Tax=Miscanthus lutarioriparius TaxID=422564 RepID=A0A811QZX5_9POAL|nr:unnamed protein product [Miscanthus lutarioriparius]